MCHGMSYNTLPARPYRAQDSHGLTGNATGPVGTKRAFIRGNSTDAYITA